VGIVSLGGAENAAELALYKNAAELALYKYLLQSARKTGPEFLLQREDF